MEKCTGLLQCNKPVHFQKIKAIRYSHPQDCRVLHTGRIEGNQGENFSIKKSKSYNCRNCRGCRVVAHFCVVSPQARRINVSSVPARALKGLTAVDYSGAKMTKLLLLDKDGTLISPKSGAKFVGDPWDQVPLPNVSDRLKKYATEGWKMTIISNQGGVAAEHKSLENCILEMKFCLELFPEILEAYFCPNFEGSECWRVWDNCDNDHRIVYNENSLTADLQLIGQFRKPNPGMLALAASFYNFDEILYVGDRPEDEGAAIAANIPFQWAADFLGKS